MKEKEIKLMKEEEKVQHLELVELEVVDIENELTPVQQFANLLKRTQKCFNE